MALATYSDLVAALSDELNRTDLESYYPNAIALFEARANRVLRTPEMETSATALTLNNGVALPADFRGAREIYVSGYVVRGLSPQQRREMVEQYPSGLPMGYSINGQTIEFVPPVSDDTEVGMAYYAAIPGLTSDNPTNWLMTSYPDAYLYGVLAYVYRKMRDIEAMNETLGVADAILSEVTADGIKKRLPAGPLIARSGIVG